MKECFKNISYIFIFIFIGSINFSCDTGSESCNPENGIETISVNLELERAEDDFFQINNTESALVFLDQHPDIAEAFFQRSQYPHDSIVANKLVLRATNPSLDTVRMEVASTFGEMEDIKSQFEIAFRHIKKNYPDFTPPKIKTMITGLADGSDILISPGLILIGLDWFIGENATYRPHDIPDYILSRMNKDHLVANCILFMSDQFNSTNLNDETMLAEMIYFGKAYAFIKEVMPCVEDNILLGYDQEQLNGIEFNQNQIWAHFVEKSLLYEKSHFIKVKYINERPSVPEIGDQCPGRIGRWLGWEIVKTYLEESDVDLVELMNNEDAAEIFRLSKYRPSPH